MSASLQLIYKKKHYAAQIINFEGELLELETEIRPAVGEYLEFTNDISRDGARVIKSTSSSISLYLPINKESFINEKRTSTRREVTMNCELLLESADMVTADFLELEVSDLSLVGCRVSCPDLPLELGQHGSINITGDGLEFATRIRVIHDNKGRCDTFGLEFLHGDREEFLKLRKYLAKKQLETLNLLPQAEVV